MHYLFFCTQVYSCNSYTCEINRETGVSQGSISQSRQGTPSVTATCLVVVVVVYLKERKKKYMQEILMKT